MKSGSVIQKILAVVFTAAVLFTVSVRETHYLFSEHHAVNEHCENHLHSGDEHGDCTVCKFDVSFFTDDISYPQFAPKIFLTEKHPISYNGLMPATTVYVNSLRGPPARA
jgi:hypothetical protein